MSYEIKSISYPAVKPILAIEADSLSDISGLEGMAEGSTCKVSDTTYVYDEVNGWAVAGTQGKELPAVTSEDNGDVLTVVEGAWAKAAPSGGGGESNVILLEVSNDGYLNKSVKDLKDLIAAGKTAMIASVWGNGAYAGVFYLVWVGYYSDNSDYEAAFVVSDGDYVSQKMATASTETDLLYWG